MTTRLSPALETPAGEFEYCSTCILSQHSLTHSITHSHTHAGRRYTHTHTHTHTHRHTDTQTRWPEVHCYDPALEPQQMKSQTTELYKNTIYSYITQNTNKNSECQAPAPNTWCSPASQTWCECKASF